MHDTWKPLNRRLIWLAAIVLLGAPGLRAEKIEILRDDFGVPHIFAASPAGAAFASGYAQAEDRLEELLRNYRKAEGTMAEAFGPEWVQHDYRQRLWRHRAVAEENYGRLSPETRAMCEGFIAGVSAYMKAHPKEVPDWAPTLAPWRVIALSRYIIWGWMEAEAGGKLLHAGIRPDPMAYHGSNEWLLAPSRTAMHAPIALIDPHLSWYGEFRFYEMRVYAGDSAISGAAIVGLPFPVLGHSRWASIAMTTGGPDTSDIFAEQIENGRYKLNGLWKPLTVRHERIGIKRGNGTEWRDVGIRYTAHGPIVGSRNGTAYSAAIPYAGEFRLIEQAWAMMNAHNLVEMKTALARLELMPQNIMVGTVQGDIYYVRNGRVPIRPKGCDPARPMPGTGACEWQGIHVFSDLPQIVNPPQGYMQNCNVSPEWLMRSSPLTPDQFAERPYLYNAKPGPPHQRASMVLDLLDAARDVTPEQAIAIAFSPQVYGAELWQARVRQTAPEHSALVNQILKWDRRADADSRGALAFYLFKTALGGEAAESVKTPADLSDSAVRGALRRAADRLAKDYPANAAYGTLFRVGREGGSRTFPVSGGTLRVAGMATPRAITFEWHGGEFIGKAGQTSTQIVILTNPPQSFMVIPLGESDHKSSGHWDDQAEKLFSRSLMKSTYFLNRPELEKHVERTERLEYPER